MTALQCPGCKAYLSITGLSNCPRCQAALPANARHSHAPAAAAAIPARPSYRWVPRDWFNVTIVGALAVLIILIVYRLVVPSDAQVHSRKISAALVQCQQRIAGLAEYGDAETPPYVKNYGSGNEFYFAWSAGSFHFKNGFGASVRMSASCAGDLSSGEIKHLTLNGKDIL